MRLKRVELVGFKSFMDRTVLDFRDGITTILGPNGCGKSNVVDAVRWVLGEQSAKQLRGEKMDDVIFKGTRKRKPLSVAEVTLLFEGAGSRLGVEYDEVGITRRVTRAGTSDYFLNRAPCRLKDIRDLFYDTGVGNNAYSVIEQEVVGQVLDPNENKVRTILEEGSGIVRYKVKRKEALRKLDLTERDLLRVEDIIDEIGRQVRSLARQVGKARRHKKLFGEVRGLELIRAHLRTHQIQHQLSELRSRAEELRTQGTGDDAELATKRAELEAMRPALDALEEDGKGRALALSQVEEHISRLEGEILVLREKIESGQRRTTEIADEVERGEARDREIQAEMTDATQERESLSAESERQAEVVSSLEAGAKATSRDHDELRESLAHAQQLSLGFLKQEADHRTELATSQSRLEAAQERESALVAELETHQTQLESLASELARAQADRDGAAAELRDQQAAHEQARAAVDELAEALEQARQAKGEGERELARLESQLEIASRIAKEYEGYREGAAALLRDDATRSRLVGPLAERLQVKSGYEACFELLFGEDADALLVDSVHDAFDLAQHLAAEEVGRASFMVRGLAASVDASEVRDLPGRPALELVRAADKAQEPAAAWLAAVRVVETTAEAVDAAVRHAGHGISFLAREGIFVRYDGLVRGGAGTRGQLSMFGRQEQVDALAQQVEEQRGHVQRASSTVEGCEARLAEGRQRRTDAEERVTLAREALQTQQEAVASRESVLAREETSRQHLTQQRDQVRTNLTGLRAEIETKESDFGLKSVDTEATHARVEELSRQVVDSELTREEAQASLAEARVELTRQQGLDRELESRLERLGHMRDDLAQRHARLAEEASTLEGNLAGWRESVTGRETELEAGFQDREARREAVRGAQLAIEGKRQEMDTVQEGISEIVARQREKAAALHEVETEVTKHELTVQNVEDRIQEKFQVEIAPGFADLDPETLPKELVAEDDTYQLSQVEELLGERQTKLDKLGPVNFVALDEYDEKKARLEFLEKQRDDLLTSKEDLLQAIDRINRTARKLFRETFEQVRTNFQDIFATLFEGGRADLILGQKEDPLEADVQIMAQPTGKAVDSVALLSGGERALTAIALLFAVYLIKPSPFCLLDEVDAPLDDVNVGRFVRLLKGFADRTQFIVITHNKLTMEAADHLYGVTMEERGVSRLVSVSFDELSAEDPLQALEDHGREAPRPAARLQPGPAVEDAQAFVEAGAGAAEPAVVEGEA